MLSGIEIVLGKGVVTYEQGVVLLTEMALAKIVEAIDDGDAEILNAADNILVCNQQPTYSHRHVKFPVV